jgi:hypothetical protein
VSIRSLATNSLLRRLPGREADRVSFAGPWLLVGDRSGELRVWTSDGARAVNAIPGGSYLPQAAANSAGTLLARVRTNGEVVLNALPNGEEAGTLPSGEPRGILRLGLAFSPTGDELATIMDPPAVGGEATLLQRDLGSQALLRDACETAGGTLSRPEWKAIVGRNESSPSACSKVGR